MIERLLCLVTVDDPSVPSRVCGLLAQRSVAISSIQLSRDAAAAQWTVQLVVCVEDELELELVIKRLNRLVDVVKIVDIGTEPRHHRRSMFVKLRPAAGDVIHVGEIARLFGAEVLELTPSAATLHLAASSERCEHFVSMLRPYTVIDVVLGAVSGTRIAPTAATSWAAAYTTEYPAPVRLAAERRRS